MKIYDVLIVGSGPSAAMAAQTLVEGGVHVCMLDVGQIDETYAPLIPNAPFTTIRETDEGQRRYFLGDQFEGAALGEIKAGAQLTPPRHYVTHETDKLLPYEVSPSSDFALVQSLAYGGLGGAWGLACFTFSKAEAEAAGLNSEALPDAYRTVAARIGISGSHDDGALHATGPGLEELQDAPEIEQNLKGIVDAYARQRTALSNNGVVLGRTPLALLTKPLGARKATQYTDMDFWANPGGSAYRPNLTIDMLREQENFTYIGKHLVLTYVEKGDVVEVIARNLENGESEHFIAKKLILAAGTFGSARIVLRSTKDHTATLPVVSDTYRYFPCLQPRTLGSAAGGRKVSYSQLSLYYDPTGKARDISSAMLYTYSSLMLFRLAGMLPIDLADMLRLLSFITPSIVIAGVHHSDSASPEKFVRLVCDETSPTGDKLDITYSLSQEELRKQEYHERELKRALRALGCYPLKRVDPGNGASIHYGGTLPFDENGAPLTQSSKGLLSGTQHVYIADGSGFRFMPAKGPTLTFMANAHLVAQNVLRSLGNA